MKDQNAKKIAETIIDEKLDAKRLMRIIRNTSIVAWQKEISEEKINNWLKNFDGSFFEQVEHERKLALWLLAHFTYYTMNDVKILCKSLFNQFLHIKLKEEKNIDLNKSIDNIITNTVFVGLGNDSESGNNILYYFRQENNLKKDSFEIRPDKRYQNIVYIDDVTISGDQALNYIQAQNILADNIYVAVLIATKDAFERLKKNQLKKIEPLSAMILDERDQAFSDCSYVFSDSEIVKTKDVVKDFCTMYGKRAVKGWGYMEGHPRGFADGQYMFGFEYNTPDNTLPIFWGTGNGWTPLFKRYPKIFDEKEYISDDRKFY